MPGTSHATLFVLDRSLREGIRDGGANERGEAYAAALRIPVVPLKNNRAREAKKHKIEEVPALLLKEEVLLVGKDAIDSLVTLLDKTVDGATLRLEVDKGLPLRASETPMRPIAHTGGKKNTNRVLAGGL